jgi:protein ImuB
MGAAAGEGFMTSRRIAAVVLPGLLVELGAEALRVTRGEANAKQARGKKKRDPPLGIVLVGQTVPVDTQRSDSEPAMSGANRVRGARGAEPPGRIPVGVGGRDTNHQPEASDAQEIKPTHELAAVNAAARRYGVRDGQTIAEASALCGHLVVRAVAEPSVEHALGRVAEAALAFGATVSIEAPDTVWVDISGAAHLFGGEDALAVELVSRVRAMGHAARVAIASGPRLAQAFARWGQRSLAERLGERGTLVVPATQSAELAAELPVAALPLDTERASWLVRLGVLTLGDLAALPRAAAASRLGDQAGAVLDLCAGRDTTPLVAYEPPAVLTEETTWDEPVGGVQPLLFVLRGLVSRMSARLSGRGQAAQVVELVLHYDRSIARLRGAEPTLRLRFDLAAPLWREAELSRVIAARLERTELDAPTLGVGLEVPSLVRAVARQLDLSRVAGGVLAGSRGLEALPVLLAELGADLGKGSVGVLRQVDAHRPESRSRLGSALSALRGRKGNAPGLRKGGTGVPRPLTGLPRAPTRLLSAPVPLRAPIRAGAVLTLDQRLYTIERVAFEQRLSSVEWWTRAPVDRDYLRLWLESPEGGIEALVYVDRESGRRYLHAVVD